MKRPWSLVALLTVLLVGAVPAAAAYDGTGLIAAPPCVALPGDDCPNIPPEDTGPCSGYDPAVGATCQITLTLPVDAPEGVDWWAHPTDVVGTTFAPPAGHLEPGESVVVTLTTRACGGRWPISFNASDGSSAVVLCSCG